MVVTDFERYPLTFGPSPVPELERLSDHLGGAWAQAEPENVISGLACGGNKTRKFEYIVPDILASGADTLVSIGGYQSQHTRQVAAVAAHLGMKSRLVQEREVDWDDPVNDKVGNIELSCIMGAKVQLDSAGFDIGILCSWESASAEGEAAGGPKRQAIGIDASATLDKTHDQVTRIANNTVDLIGRGREIADAEVDIRPGGEGPAFGIADEATVNAIRTTAQLEGVILDLAGGQFALNAYSSIF